MRAHGLYGVGLVISMATVCQQMASTRVSANLPIYDPSKSSQAYGNRAIPKLNRELQSVELAVRQQALLLLCDVLHQRENLAAGLRGGIAATLKGLLEDVDAVVRQRAAHALGIIAQHALGRQAFLDLQLILALSKLFSDAEYTVRYSAQEAVEMCARTSEGAQGTVAAGLVPLCVEKVVQEESTQLRALILDTLHWCFQVDTAQGLLCKTLPICTQLLSHHSPELRSRAARTIYDLTVPYEGKDTVCTEELGCIPLLVGLLCDEETFVRSQAAAALMSIAVITKGKYSELEAGALPNLVALMGDSNSEARLNSIKSLTMLAETPKGKAELQSALPKLEELISGENEMVSKAAETAQKVITWKP